MLIPRCILILETLKPSGSGKTWGRDLWILELRKNAIACVMMPFPTYRPESACIVKMSFFQSFLHTSTHCGTVFVRWLAGIRHSRRLLNGGNFPYGNATQGLNVALCRNWANSLAANILWAIPDFSRVTFARSWTENIVFFKKQNASTLICLQIHLYGPKAHVCLP